MPLQRFVFLIMIALDAPCFTLVLCLEKERTMSPVVIHSVWTTESFCNLSTFHTPETRRTIVYNIFPSKLLLTKGAQNGINLLPLLLLQVTSYSKRLQKGTNRSSLDFINFNVIVIFCRFPLL